MDPREQIGDHTEALRAMLDGRQMQIWTTMPGIVQSFRADHMTCEVQVAIGGLQTKPDGSQVEIQLPLLVDCPVLFMGGGGFTLTFTPKKGDECLVHFASRCFDAWWQSSGVQKQQEFRMHDLSDGFVLVGPRSVPRVLTNIQDHAVQLRADDGSTYIEINSGQIVKVVAPSGINLNGFVIDSNGNAVTPGDVTASGISLKTHIHSGVQTGGGDTGPPV